MPKLIKMPKLSDTMTEGTLAKWHIKEGDTVEMGKVIADVETDKATMEMQAFEEGKVRSFVDEREGKEAVTFFRLLADNGKRALVEAIPHTGRTHQIRVHLQASAFPIVGDSLYGKKGATLALRATFLSYEDPFQKKRISIQAPTARFLRTYGFPGYGRPASTGKTQPG